MHRNDAPRRSGLQRLRSIATVIRDEYNPMAVKLAHVLDEKLCDLTHAAAGE